MTLAIDKRLGIDIKATELAFMTAKTEALRDLGLSVAQYAALLALRDNPGITGAGLGRACMVTPQAAAAILKTLGAKGLVARGQDDWNRSSRTSHLTTEGENIITEADRRAGAVEQAMHDALSADERAQLRALLERCRTAIHS